VVDVIIQQLSARGISVQSHLRHGIDIHSIADNGWQGVIINGEGAMHGGQKNSHLFSGIGQEMSRRESQCSLSPPYSKIAPQKLSPGCGISPASTRRETQRRAPGHQRRAW
jgi:hypothetical protein